MLKKLENKFKCIIASNKGMAVYIVMFFLLPLMLLVPAAAIDISTYLAVRTQFQNALDISAATALNRSTLDNHRADKILKVIFNDPSSNNDFTKKLKESIDINLKTNSTVVNSNQLQFIPGLPLTPFISNLTISCTDRGGVEYTGNDSDSSGLIDGGGVRREYGTNYDIELVLNTKVKLPVYEKIGYFFKLGMDSTLFEVPITVKSAIRGIRIKSPNDFNDYGFEKI